MKLTCALLVFFSLCHENYTMLSCLVVRTLSFVKIGTFLEKSEHEKMCAFLKNLPPKASRMFHSKSMSGYL